MLDRINHRRQVFGGVVVRGSHKKGISGAGTQLCSGKGALVDVWTKIAMDMEFIDVKLCNLVIDYDILYVSVGRKGNLSSNVSPCMAKAVQ